MIYWDIFLKTQHMDPLKKYGGSAMKVMNGKLLQTIEVKAEVVQFVHSYQGIFLVLKT